MVIVRDSALLLRRYPYSESSLIAHVCTREHGRVHLIAKGAYRPTSRYFAVLDYFDTLEIDWDYNPQRELASLRSGSIPRRRRQVCDDMAIFRAAMSILELTDIACRPAQSEETLFDLLQSSLDALESGASQSAPSAEFVQVAFELSLLQHLGLGISLDLCAMCGRIAPASSRAGQRASFSASAGGRLCSNCAAACRTSGRRVGTMPVQVLEDARQLADLGVLASGDIGPERLEKVRDLVERFLDYHLETRPRTQRAFLAHPNRNAHSPSSTVR